MLRSVGSNWVVTAATVLVTYLLTPFVLHTIGAEAYGTWAVVTSLTGYLGLIALGVPMASVRYLAQHVAEGDVRKTNEVIGSCLGLYLMVGVAALLVGVGLFGFFTATYELSPATAADARAAFGFTILVVSAGFAALLPEGIFAAHGDFVVRNAVRLAALALRLVLTLGWLASQASLVTLALVQLGCVVFDFSLSYLIIRRRYPGIRFSLGGFEWSVVRRIFSFSVYALLLQAGLRLSFETHALVIGAADSLDAVPHFTVASSFVVYLMDLVVAIAAVVMPAATRLKAQDRTAELRETFLKWSKIALSLTLMAGVFLIVLGPRFIAWWIDPSFERPSGQVLQILVLSSLVFLPVRGVAMPILMGLGKPKAPAIGIVVAGVANLVLSLALVGPLGLAGVALGTAIPNVAFACFILHAACRELSVPLTEYVRYVVPRAALGAMPAVAALFWFRVVVEVNTFAGLAAAGATMTALFGVMWVFYVYRSDPFVNVAAPFDRLRTWRRK
jgi:O-antigen/teichoic acid export membrane protein